MKTDNRKHIAVKPKTHKEFKALAIFKGMTQDGLINYFLKNG